MPTFRPARISRQLELVKITTIVRIKTSYNKHVLQYTESLETSFLSFRESIVIPITNHLDATMYFNLGSIIGSGIFQTDYSEKLRRMMKNKSAFDGV